MQNNPELLLKKITPIVIDKMKKDTRIFDQMTKTNEAFLYKIAQKFSPQGHHTLDDYVQIARLGLWKAVQKYDITRKDASGFGTFAWKVIYNDILQEVNKINKRGSTEISIESFTRKFDNDSTAEYAETFFKGRSMDQCKNFEDGLLQDFTIQNFMKDMDEIHKKIFDLRYLQKMKHKEIAEALNINFATYKVIFYKRVKPQIDKLAGILKDESQL